MMPSNPGSAIGLRVWPWISVPAMPKAAPAASAVTVRGQRISRIAISETCPSGASSAWRSSAKLEVVLPIHRLIPMAAPTPAARISSELMRGVMRSIIWGLSRSARCAAGACG